MSFTGKPENYLNKAIANEPFYPELDLGEFQRIYRLPTEYTQELVEQKLRMAVADCNALLIAKRAEWIGQGHFTLADVPGETFGGVATVIDQYKSAVYNRAKGLLLMEFPTFTRREQAENAAKDSAENFQYFLAQAGRALRRLIGVPENVSVALL
jgi:hypothetical protein